MANFPPDQFDEIPEDLARVGAHRAPPKPGRGWIRFAWAALATIVLVVVGLFGLSLVNPDLKLPLPFSASSTPSATATTPTADTTPTVPAVTDPTTVDPALGLSISVLNGSSRSGLQDTAGDIIKAAGWPDPSRAESTTHDATTTTVYYSSAEFEGIARGLVQLLGTGTVQLSDVFQGTPVTIVVGDDYADLTS